MSLSTNQFMLAVAAAPIALHLQGCSEEDDVTNRVGGRTDCCDVQEIEVVSEQGDKKVLYCGVGNDGAPSIAIPADCADMNIEDLNASLDAVLGSAIQEDEVEIFSAKGNFVGAERAGLFGTLKKFTSVEVISIRESSIESLPDDWLPTSCVIFDLFGNDLTTVEITGEDTIGSSLPLMQLNIGNNNMKEIKLTNLFNLSDLDLSENDFKTFNDVHLGESVYQEQLTVNLSNQQDLDVVTITNEPFSIWVSQFIKDLNICGNGEEEGDYLCDTTPDDVDETPSDLFYEVVAHFFKTDCCVILPDNFTGDGDMIFCGGDDIADGLPDEFGDLEHCRSITTFDVVASLPAARAQADEQEMTIELFDIKADLSSNSFFIFGFFLDATFADFWSGLKTLDMRECSLPGLPGSLLSLPEPMPWIPKSVELLELDENNLTDVTLMGIPEFSLLKTLKLPNNGLQKLTVMDFDHLDDLNASQNELESFANLVFLSSGEVDRLSLNEVDISSQQLDLDMCSIDTARYWITSDLASINISGLTCTDEALCNPSTVTDDLVDEVLAEFCPA